MRSGAKGAWALLGLLSASAVGAQEPQGRLRPQEPPPAPFHAPLLGLDEAAGGVGVVPTGLLLRRLEGVKRVLMIGAHPDDESTTMLATLAHSLGAETAYLSLTRGDGGQNLIGPELWEGLGIIRTGELEAARRLDGGVQYFTRAFDFGFSKSAEETLAIWPRDQVLADMVGVIRSFRPHVVISVWSGTPSDGHGHHQASGQLALEAFRARPPSAGSEGSFEPEWTARKFYLSERRRTFDAQPGVGEEGREVVTLPAGGFDPLLGRSPSQIAGASRSQHRSQQMGSSEPLGPRTTGAVFVEGSVEAGDGLFAGVDTTLAGAFAGAVGVDGEAVRTFESAFEDRVRAARLAFGPDLEETADHLLAALGPLEGLDSLVHGWCREPGFDGPRCQPRPSSLGALSSVRDKISQTTQAFLAASGIVVDVRASRPYLVPGSSSLISVMAWNGSRRALDAVHVVLELPGGWESRLTLEDGASEGSIPPGSLASFTYSVRLPEDAEPSRLYYLREARGAGSYRGGEAAAAGGDREGPFRPRDLPPVSALVAFTPEGGRQVRVRRHWRYVGVDGARGEFSEPVLVVPGLNLAVSPSTLLWPRSRAGVAELSVTVSTESEEGASGEVELVPPAGWSAMPRVRPFELPGAGSERVVSFELAPEGVPAPGRHAVEVVARTGGQEYRESLKLIDYEHIERTPLHSPASLSLSVVPVELPPGIRVGYIQGSGDLGPEALRQMGAEVEILDSEALGEGDFSRFDAVVLGVRAYETREEVRAANLQLLDYARAGGTVINQYNQYRFAGGGYAPHPIEIGRPAPRVSVETAPVTVLEPDAPVFTTPNRITAADFEGWVQERGLYFASEWDEAYLPLLELNDPGEPPRRGALLVAEVGEGVYVYAALSFFRQWSERVPGAYRLFANLVSLKADDWREYRATAGHR